MKLLTLIAIFIFIHHQSVGQLEQGQFLVGGHISFKHSKNDLILSNYKSNEFAISPAVGVFVVKKLVAGINFSYDWYRQISISPTAGNSKTYSYSYSPFVRYYLLNAQQSFNLFTQLNYNYIRYTQKYGGGKISDAGKGYAVSAGPVIFLSRQLGLEFVVGYRHANRAFDLGKEHTVFSSIGLQAHLGRMKKGRY